MTHLTPNFTLEEFTASDTAARLGIDNSLPATLLIAATDTCYMLERIRAHLSQLAGKPVPILVTSGYRCLELNTAIGSGPGSDHVRALAADFKAPAFGSPFEVCQALAAAADQLAIGQLIHEHTWIHVSTRLPTKSVNRILTVRGKAYEAGIQA